MQFATASLLLTAQLPSQENSTNKNVHHSTAAVLLQAVSTQHNSKQMKGELTSNAGSEYSDKVPNFNLTRLLASSCDCV